jgi:hypothetical protein
MELSNHRTPAVLAAALFALATVALTPGSADASRLPADPITFVGTPAPVARFVIDAQAANVWAELLDLRS